jgi:TFIIF-interacting CTD phosphatase-like protein
MTYRINVIKRPGVEEFLAKVGDQFEVVIFTASLAEVTLFSFSLC